jgi:hypothetical protein
MICFSLVLLNKSFGATYYLAVGGSDSNSGTSSSAPWYSPNHAVNCGDVIIALPSASYNSTAFQQTFGTVTCPAGNNVAWLKCEIFDACKVTIPFNTFFGGIYVDNSFWGVQGFEVTVSTSTTFGACFQAEPNFTTQTEIHHIIFANDVANGCAQGGFDVGRYGAGGVDYFVAIGNIAYNTVSGSTDCNSAFDIYEPIQSDTLPGTHIYVAGNFAYDNVEPPSCEGGTATDGEGVLFDTFDGSHDTPQINYTQQAVIDNNIVFLNYGRGIEVYNNIHGSPHASIYVRHNTSWGNATGAVLQTAGDGCGELEISYASSTEDYANLVETNDNDVAGCAGQTHYPFFGFYGDGGDQVYNNFAYSSLGNTCHIDNSGTFACGPNNTFGTNPLLTNPIDPGAPHCSDYSNVPACMAAVIASFAPMNPAAVGYGYQAPSTTQVYDPMFPRWLCNVQLPAGLVTMGCMLPTAPTNLTAVIL